MNDTLTAAVVGRDLKTDNNETNFRHLIAWLLKRSFGKIHPTLHVHFEIIGVQEIHFARSAIAVILHRDATERRQTTINARSIVAAQTLVARTLKDFLKRSVNVVRREDVRRLLP